jgi:hypothetical protein
MLDLSGRGLLHDQLALEDGVLAGRVLRQEERVALEGDVDGAASLRELQPAALVAADGLHLAFETHRLAVLGLREDIDEGRGLQSLEGLPEPPGFAGRRCGGQGQGGQEGGCLRGHGGSFVRVRTRRGWAWRP